MVGSHDRWSCAWQALHPLRHCSDLIPPRATHHPPQPSPDLSRGLVLFILFHADSRTDDVQTQKSGTARPQRLTVLHGHVHEAAGNRGFCNRAGATKIAHRSARRALGHRGPRLQVRSVLPRSRLNWICSVPPGGTDTAGVPPPLPLRGSRPRAYSRRFGSPSPLKSQPSAARPAAISCGLK